MLEELFKGVFDASSASVIAPAQFLLCLGCSLVIGLALALCYMRQARHTRSFVTTLALLPGAVCVVIMAVNGNVGAGVAVAGAFNLVRFRSVPGTAREIGALFLAMGAGMLAGMGYLAYALLFTAVLSGMMLLYDGVGFGAERGAAYRTLHITIPENLDYSQVFTDLWSAYTRSWELVQVKTTNLGSLYKLTYDVVLRDPGAEKELIDQLRCRNGNLEITVSRQETVCDGL